jgi:adenylate cyclase
LTQPHPLSRRLAAIIAADIAGYSRLMHDDEEDTHRRVRAIFQESVVPEIASHHGRLVKNTGDGFLAEFGSVVDAVRCAIAIQAAAKAMNSNAAGNEEVLFRMGVNVGDIIAEAGDIFGDGVNVAARLQALAEPGTICISSKVREEIEGRIGVTLHKQGTHVVKNIAKPVHVFRIDDAPRSWRRVWFRTHRTRRLVAGALLLSLIAVSLGTLLLSEDLRRRYAAVMPSGAKPLPRPPETTVLTAAGPSLAVMPFENLTGDPSKAYVADGLAEDVTSTLSMLSNMLVVSRYSVAQYRGKAVSVQQVAREQGVDHLLLASVQQAGEQYRVTAQLVDAASGQIVWSERYNYEPKHLLAAQDDITRRVVTALRIRLNEGEQARAFATEAHSFEAWALAMKGYAALQSVGLDTNAEARRLLHKAVELEPQYATAWSYLAGAYALAARFGFGGHPAQMLDKAMEIATRALEINPDIPDAHATVGSVYLFRRDYDKAIGAGRRAVELGPSNAEAHALLGQSLYYAGELTEAIAVLQKAQRLSPRHPSWYLFIHALAVAERGDFNGAISIARRGLEKAEGPFNRSAAHLILAFALAETGQLEEARSHASEAYRLNPTRGLGLIERTSLVRDKARLKRFIETLRGAGMPE